MKKRLLPFILLAGLAAGCSKKDDASPSSGPREYQVTYQVTAINYSQARIIYRDATGTQVTEENVSLPKTYSFKRTMQSADAVTVGAFPTGGDASASITCTIQLDGATVNTKSDVGPNPQPVASYVIP